VDSSVVSYYGGWNVMYEEQPVGRKEPNRKQSEETKQSRWGFRGMTVRDWLQLLIVPLALVVIGFLFTAQQDQRQQKIEDQRAEQAQQIENQRAEAERELAEQRAQDEALQAYLNQMSQLMLEKKLLEAEPSNTVHTDPVYTLAQARTSTVILRLDAEHNASVIRFLRDSGLAWNVSSGKFIVDEDSGAPPPASVSILRGIALNRADLSDADLSHADLSGAYAIYEDPSGDFVQAHADLSEADLRGADLTDADLSEATGVTNEELEQQVSTLEGATMPNGQKYEEWLMDKKAQGKDEKSE
jgi:hypothetical protein